MMIDTIEKAAEHILSEMTSIDMLMLKEGPYSRIEFGRHVRNRLGLWYFSPLTENWRNNPTSRTIINYIDCSEDHPDNVSAKIVKLILERIKR